MKKIIVAVAMALMFCGCKHTFVDERNDIVAVWKHEVGRYSITYKEGHELIDYNFNKDGRSVYPSFSIIADVPEDSNMWYEARYDLNANMSTAKVFIHVRSIDDINGAGWNYGKFGRGSTERVQ